MAKRDEAFELFSQGKGRDDPEVVALGLTKETIRKYYREWGKLHQPEAPESVVAETPPVVTPTEMLVSDVSAGALFEYKGQIYKKKRTVYSGQVIAELMFKAYYTNIFTPARESVYLTPDTIVIPK